MPRDVTVTEQPDPARDRYRLLRLEESLFIGEVHVAERVGEEGFVKQVRVWTLRPELCRDEAVVSRLLAELTRAAELSVSAVCQILDVWREGGGIAVASEHLAGPSFRQAVAEAVAGGLRGMPLEVVVGTALEVARALELAHEPRGGGRPIVHGDLRPEHVLLGHEGAVKVTGFGFGSFLSAVGPRGAWCGLRRCYQPPERVEAGALEPGCDLYALGLMTLEAALAPDPEKIEDPVALLRLVRAGADLQAAGLRPLPDDLALCLLGATAEDPADRYPSAAAMAADLHGLLLERGFTGAVEGLVRQSLDASGQTATTVRRHRGEPESVEESFEDRDSPTRVSRPPRASFSGRRAVLRRVGQALAGTFRGRGQAVLVRAEPGMGRSRVLRETAERLAGSDRKLATLTILGDPSETRAQYVAVLRLLASAMGLPPHVDLDRVRAEADRLRAYGLEADAIAAVRAVLGEGTPPGPARLAGLLSEAAIRCVAALCWEQITVIAWDDVQLADQASLGCLYELLCRLESMPAVVLMTAPADFALPWALPEGSEELTLGPMSREECEVVALAALKGPSGIDPALLELVLEGSGGNPQLVEEAVELLVETDELELEGSTARLRRGVSALPTLAAVVRARLEALGDEGRAVAVAAAVAGPALGARLVGRATGIPEPEVSRLLDGMTGPSGFLLPGPEGLRFRNSRLLAAVLEAASSGLLQAIRRQVARAILESRDEPGPVLDDHVAGLLEATGSLAEASEVLARSAARQEDRGDYGGATQRFARALELGRSAGSLPAEAELSLSVALGRTSLLSLDLGLGEEALGRAASLADLLGDAAAGARARTLLSRHLARNDRKQEAIDAAEEAIRIAERGPHLAEVAEASLAIAESLQQWGLYGPDIEHVERAAEIASSLGEVERYGAALQLGVSHAMAIGDLSRYERLLERARFIAESTGSPLLACQIRRTEGLARWGSRDLLGALQVDLEGIALAHAHGLTEHEIVMLHNAAECYLDLGRPRQALYYFTESLRQSRAARYDRLTEANEMFVGFVEAVHLGLDSGLERLRSGIEMAERLERIWTLNQGHRLLGEALLERGEHDGAIRHLEEAVRIASESRVGFFVDRAARSLERARRAAS